MGKKKFLSNKDLTGGTLVPVEGPDSPLFALEINPEKAREEFRSTSQKTGGNGIKDFMDGMGLGMIVEHGHTLRLLSLPDFPDASIGKILKVESFT
ncbi:ATPase ARSA1 [Camellia lanceoleosa]|uniref:ATPase ARSA1 n=1 Tax=Camellia lanceoleosa TaxID=1840588 RepID=A0ACC0FUN5_9ERIC|nr:ATPase ARSA1 [Camellia lanceoleosa]